MENHHFLIGKSIITGPFSICNKLINYQWWIINYCHFIIFINYWIGNSMSSPGGRPCAWPRAAPAPRPAARGVSARRRRGRRGRAAARWAQQAPRAPRRTRRSRGLRGLPRWRGRKHGKNLEKRPKNHRILGDFELFDLFAMSFWRTWWEFDGIRKFFVFLISLG